MVFSFHNPLFCAILAAMFQIRTVAPLLLLTASLFSCKKDEPNTQNLPTSGTYSTLPATLKAFAAPVQTLNVDADSGGSYKLPDGIRFLIPKNAFRTPSGDTVHGNVQVTVAQYTDRSDMIYSNVLTDNTDTGSLSSFNSAGAFLFLPFQKGLSLGMSRSAGKAVVAYLPQKNLQTANPSTPAAQSFIGTKNANPIGEVTWTPNPRALPSTSTAFDTLAYRFDTVGYHQAAVPYDFLTGTATVRFSLGSLGGMNANNSFLYLLPKGIRSVVDLGSAAWLKNRSYSVQDKSEATLVGAAVVDGRFYGGISSVKLENNRSYSVTLSEQQPDSFKIRVQKIY